MQFQSVEFHERGKKHKENVQKRIEEVRSWKLIATLVVDFINIFSIPETCIYTRYLVPRCIMATVLVLNMIIISKKIGMQLYTCV